MSFKSEAVMKRTDSGAQCQSRAAYPESAPALDPNTEGCWRLIYAMFRQVIVDLQGRGAFTRWGVLDPQAYKDKLRLEALEFVISPDRHPFSFRWLCKRVGKDYGEVLDGIRTGAFKEWGGVNLHMPL